MAPQTLFEDRITRLDLRLSHSFTIERFRLQLNLDAYNALNANSVRAVQLDLRIGVDAPPADSRSAAAAGGGDDQLLNESWRVRELAS